MFLTETTHCENVLFCTHTLKFTVALEFLHNMRLFIDRGGGFSEYSQTVAVVKDNDWINIDISTMANMR